MTTTPPHHSPTASPEACQEPAAFIDNGIEEPETQRVRAALGLRPALYDEFHLGHPDQRPCPSWCWVGRSGGEFGHELDLTHPLEAYHGLSSKAVSVASLYPGRTYRPDVEDVYLMASTVEVDLEQVGQREPVVSIGLRTTSSHNEPEWRPDLLVLTVTDAQELAAALSYIVDVADGRREPVE